MDIRKHLGDLLVEAGIITPVTLGRALERQKNIGGRLGEILEEMGVINQEELIQSLSRQFGFKKVARIVSHHFSKTLLDLVPAEIALMKLAFPLKLAENVLYLAVNDPFDLETMDLLSKRNNLKIVPVLATRDDLMAAISFYYRKTGSDADPRRKILVVDDDEKDAQIIELALLTEGFNIKSTSDPLKAFNLAVEFEPDLVICDSIMPRLDGFGVLRTLKADFRTEQLPVIMLTSLATGEDEKKAVESDCIDFIPKPLKPMRIVSRVKRAFRFITCMKEYGVAY
ncbi:response regulator [Geobacter sp. SVR]|uniref:response regulator n=1 Tax=Geobacter sp. SVR TaxID=2495594 RepID=UPI00143F0367|nr:response regulator [Geobacter sp. SVR]BCS53832.1 two-component system response regulator [Geobacter sp. SVR]GCF85659.1 two-component system response regulator [Geobacter sp. SVR]